MKAGLGEVVLVLLSGCGAATDVLGEDGADPPGCPAPREDSMSSGYCGREAVCEGVSLSVPSGGAHGEGGGPLHAGVMVVNCGSDQAPRCIEVALRVRNPDGSSEIVGRSWTSVPLAPGLGEEVPVEAPWESWRSFLDEGPGLCIEAVVDPEGQIGQCETGDEVSNALPVLAGGCTDPL